MDQHTLIKQLVDLAIELGRTPTKLEFYDMIKGAKHSLRKFYGERYNDLVLASGLKINSSQWKTQGGNEIFKKDIGEHLRSYQPKIIERSKKYPKILIIGDLHFPFVNQDALDAAHQFSKEAQPDYIVQLGDLYDMYSHAKFPRSHNLFTPKEEEYKARAMAEKMWKRFKLDCPEAKLIQCVGNHDVRPIKRTMEAVPSIEHWLEKYFQEIMSFPGVHSVLDSREEFRIEDIIFIHGYASGIGRHRDHFNNNVCVGHTHVGGVSFRQQQQKVIWELNVGYLADQFAKGLSYTPTRSVKWTLGIGFIDNFGPRFVPY